jgi:alpha/beta superfamily hydrolase
VHADLKTSREKDLSVSETILLPGLREAKASLDTGESADTTGVTDTDADAVVVACPPHPQQRGHRGDGRLVAVSDALTERGIDCLRFDYGPWDEGRGERADAQNALRWAYDRYERVGLFGFSFGGAIALLTAADAGPGDLAAVSTLAPAGQLVVDGDDAVWALDYVDVPTQIVYGVRDDTAEWETIVDRARALGFETVERSADHFFIGQEAKVARLVADFLEPQLVE